MILDEEIDFLPILKNKIENRLRDFYYIEDMFFTVSDEEKRAGEIIAYYSVGFEGAQTLPYKGGEVAIYKKNGQISKYGICWGNSPVHLNSIHAMQQFLEVVTCLPFSINFEQKKVPGVRYEVFFPEYTVKTLDECVELLKALERVLNELEPLFLSGEMN